MNCRSEVWICLGLLIIYSELNFWNYMYIFYPELHFLAYLAKWHIFLIHPAILFFLLRNYFRVYWATLINVYIYIWTYSLLTNLMKTCVLWEGLNFVVIFQTLKSDPLLYKERKLYVYFFTNPACLRQLFDEMSSRLQAQKM